MIAAKVGKKLCCCQMATQQVALKSEEKIQSLLDNAPNYLVRTLGALSKREA